MGMVRIMDNEQKTIATLQAKITSLHEYIATLEQHVEHLREQEEQYRSLVELSPDGIAIHRKGQFLYMNTRGIEMMGARDFEQITTRSVLDYVHPDYRNMVQQRVQSTQHESVVVPFIEEQFVRFDGQAFDVEVAGTPIMYGGEPASQVIFRDITERKQAERNARAMVSQQQTIEAQKAVIRELSTPLIPLSEDVMLMPLIGAMDESRTELVMETLLEGIVQHEVETVILDITGISSVDTSVVTMLINVTQAVHLIGATIFLTGINPTMASTLVQLDADLHAVKIYRTVQRAVQEVLGFRAAMYRS